MRKVCVQYVESLLAERRITRRLLSTNRQKKSDYVQSRVKNGWLSRVIHQVFRPTFAQLFYSSDLWNPPNFPPFPHPLLITTNKKG